MHHVRYQQTYQRVPVFGGELIVHLNSDGDVRVVNGRVVPEIDLDPTPRLSAQHAIELAVEAFRTSPPGSPVLDAWSPCEVAVAEDETGEQSRASAGLNACGTVDCGGWKEGDSEKRPPSPFFSPLVVTTGQAIQVAFCGRGRESFSGKSASLATNSLAPNSLVLKEERSPTHLGEQGVLRSQRPVGRWVGQQ